MSNKMNGSSQKGGRHCTPQQYEKMLCIIEVCANFDCLCNVYILSVPGNNGSSLTKMHVYQLMADSVGLG